VTGAPAPAGGSVRSGGAVAPWATRLPGVGATRAVAAAPALTAASVVRALEGAEAALSRARPRTGLEDLLEHPLDAFFAVENLVQEGETWRDLAARITLTPEQLQRSEHAPVTLAPMNVALYRGLLFPDAYFMRSTLYWNPMREQLAHVGTFDIAKFTARMPFIDLRGALAGGLALDDGTAARVHEHGGARQLMRMLRERAGGADVLTAYRGCARSEFEVQRFVRDLLREPQDAPPSPQERARLTALVARFADDVTAAVEAAVPPAGTRAELAAAIADVLGGHNQATFVGFDAAKAQDFQDTEVDPRSGESSEVIVTYRLPLDALEQHVERGTLYLGVEFDALEAGFGEHASDPSDQSTKLLLFRSLVDETPG
jgi:hypothetical protein